MKLGEAMKTLESMGTEQNRKVYRRHGIGDDQFGVSFANLGKLRKRIKTDHALAGELWATGNADARILATMIADPAELSAAEMDAWLSGLDYYPLVDSFAALVGRSPHARARVRAWTRSSEEWTARAGFHLLASLAVNDAEIEDAFFAPHVAAIEKRIHRAKNRAREAMNGALIAIGARSPALERLALAAARRIGKVEVDHGETSCKTPDAAAYIARARARKQRVPNVKRRAGKAARGTTRSRPAGRAAG